MSRLVIFNRTALADDSGWIHIVPKGELPNAEAGIVQVLDDAALDSILRNIENDKVRLGSRWPGLYAGEEHFIYNDEKSSAAFAWFKDFQKRDNGIWANADGLTDLGVAAIKNKRFKFTSFVANREDAQKIGDNRYRILSIDTVGFTNQANGKELLTPITNRAAPAHKSENPTKEGAVQSIKLITNRLQREHKCNFETAWNIARHEAPETFAAMAGQTTTVSNRGSNARKLTVICNRMQRETGCDFKTAWGLARAQHAELFTDAHN